MRRKHARGARRRRTVLAGASAGMLAAFGACASSSGNPQAAHTLPVASVPGVTATTTTTPTTAAANGETPERLVFTGAVHGTMSTAHRGYQTSDTLCTSGTWALVGTVVDTDYSLTMQMAVGYKGPGTYASNQLTPGANVSSIQVQLAEEVQAGQTPPQYYDAVPGKVTLAVNHDERSGTIDAELAPLQGATTIVHVSGSWACRPDS